jgi:hypothetical protein
MSSKNINNIRNMQCTEPGFSTGGEVMLLLFGGRTPVSLPRKALPQRHTLGVVC